MKRCPQCKKEYSSTNYQQVFCTVKCRNAFNQLKKKERIAKKEKKEGVFDWDDYEYSII